MTSTVRSVTVHLDADNASYDAKMARSGRMTDQAFDRAQVGAKSTSRELGGVEKQLGAVDARAVTLSRDMRALDRDTRAVDRSINQLTGRLRLAVDLGASLGPALIPLGAGGVAGVVAMVSQLGAAAGGLGVGILAVSGLSDGLEALNTYQLAPTSENLEALNEELRNLGPAGAQFVQYIDTLEPKLRQLQLAARSGFLPDAQEGIDDLLTSLPAVRDYVRDVSDVLGGLASDAGADLTGDGWAPFFDYIQTDGVRLLDQLARSIGNVGQGVGNMLAGFGDVTGDFSSGLLEVTDRFADWSTGLDDNAEFQEFVDYLRESGPLAIDFLTSLTTSLAAVVEAGAPLGEVTLPLLTGLVDVLGTLAGSDLGTPLLATAAGLAALNRATTGLTRAGQSNFIQANYVKPVKDLRAAAPGLGQVGTYFYRMGQSAEHASKRTVAARDSVRGFTRELGGLGKGAALMGGLALAGTGVADGMGLSNTMSMALMGTIAGPWGAAVGGGIGLAMDFAASNNEIEEAARNLDDALRSGAITAITEYRDALAQLVDENERSATFSPFDVGAAIEDPTRNFKAIKAGLLEQFGVIDEYRSKIQDADDQLAAAQGMRTLLGVPLGLAREFDVAAQSVEDFAASFAGLNDMLDRSGSLIAYEAALDSLSESLQESGSFNVGIKAGRTNLQNLNGVVGQAIERSEMLKEQGDELGSMRILRRAKDDLKEFASESEAAERAVKPYIAELDNLSSKRPRPVLDADEKPLKGKVSDADRDLARIQERIAEAMITGDNSALARAVAASRRLLADLDGDSATTYIRTVRVNANGGGSGMGPQPTTSAEGGSVPKTGGGYADRHLYLLADGEEVISNRRGQADRHRGLLKDINAGRRLADGGTTGDDDEDDDELTKAERRARVRRRRRRAIDRAYNQFSVSPETGASGVRSELDDLRDALRDAKVKWTDAMGDNARALTKAARRYDDLSEELRTARDTQAAYRDQVAGSIDHEIFGNGLAGLTTQLEADRNDNRAMLDAIKAAEGKGLDGGLAQALYASGDLTSAQQISGLSAEGIAQLEALYADRSDAQAALGQFAAKDVYGPQVKALEARVQRAEERFDNRMDKFLDDQLPKTLEESTYRGTRDGIEGRERDGAQRSRAGR